MIYVQLLRDCANKDTQNKQPAVFLYQLYKSFQGSTVLTCLSSRPFCKHMQLEPKPALFLRHSVSPLPLQMTANRPMCSHARTHCQRSVAISQLWWCHVITPCRLVVTDVSQTLAVSICRVPFWLSNTYSIKTCKLWQCILSTHKYSLMRIYLY